MPPRQFALVLVFAVGLSLGLVAVATLLLPLPSFRPIGPRPEAPVPAPDVPKPAPANKPKVVAKGTGKFVVRKTGGVPAGCYEFLFHRAAQLARNDDVKGLQELVDSGQYCKLDTETPVEVLDDEDDVLVKVRILDGPRKGTSWWLSPNFVHELTKQELADVEAVRNARPVP